MSLTKNHLLHRIDNASSQDVKMVMHSSTHTLLPKTLICIVLKSGLWNTEALLHLLDTGFAAE